MQHTEAGFDFAAFAGSMLDAVILADPAGVISYVNQVTCSMFGYMSAELVGQSLENLMPERYRERHRRGMARIQAGGPAQLTGQTLNLHGLKKDGIEFPIELSLTQWRNGANIVFSGIIRDVAAQQESDRRESTRHSLTRLIAESRTLMEAVTRVMETICTNMNWTIGAMWCNDPRTDTFRCVQFWDSQAPRRSQFEKETLSLQFQPGEGMPGQVWAGCAPIWWTNLSERKDFPRSASARQLRLSTAFGFPIVDPAGLCVGVLEFFTENRREPDTRLLEMMADLGRMIGTLLHRAHAEAAILSIVEQMQIGVHVYRAEDLSDDRSLRLISANPASTEILGIPADEIVGNLIDENFPEVRAAGIPARYLEVVHTQRSIHLDDVIFDARVFEVRAFPLPNHCVGVAFENITKRKRAEQLIAAERRALERIVEGATLDVLVEEVATFSDAQTPGMIASILLLSADGTRLKYASAPHLAPDFRRATDSLEVSDPHAPTSLSIAQRETIVVSSIANNDRALTIREIALQQGYRACWSTPIITVSREVVGTMALFYEEERSPNIHEMEVVEFAVRLAAIIIERRQSEDAIRESEERFNSFMRHAPVAAFIKDAGSNYLWINEELALRFGLRLEDVVGKTDFEIFDRETAEQNVMNDRQVMEAGHPIDSSSTMTTIDGVDRSLLMFKFPLELSTGERHIGGVAIDVTERNTLEKQLERSERISGLGRVAASIAHEINNVLMGILPFAEVVRMRAKDDQSLQNAALHIGRGVERGKRITQEILAFTRSVEPVVRPFECRSWLEGIVQDLRTLLGDGIDLQVVLPPSDVYVRGDPLQLHQVLANLSLNARDAMDGAGTLRIAASACTPAGTLPFAIIPHPGGSVHFTVQDNGTGIPPALISRIFEPLFTTKRNVGTGLGLAIAHQIISAHGGEIHVDSTEGAGTTFHLLLPCAARPLETASPAPKRFETRLRRVVLVEDDLAVGEGLVALLEADGVEARWVQTGAEAASAIAAFQPDLLILDVGLPDTNGFDLYGRLRQVFPALPTIFSTGHGDESLMDRFGSAPVALLMKPYDYDSLARIMSELLPPLS